MRTYAENKVKGTLYGLAIGDAMGVTTEFLSQDSIKRTFKKRVDIIGKGCFNLYPGEVTDPTEMAFCVCEALKKSLSYRKSSQYRDKLMNQSCRCLEDWANTYPFDMERCCQEAITHCQNLNYLEWIHFSFDPSNRDNSNLFRCIPMILTRHKTDYLLDQSRLTHNSSFCDNAVVRLREIMIACLTGKEITTEVFSSLPPRFRHVMHTIDSALYHLETTATFEGAVMEAIYHGGDTDAIGALTGSLAGAMHGYQSIPKRWISQLRPEVIEKLEEYCTFLINLNTF